MLLPNPTSRFKNAFIYTVALVISLLLLINIVLINQNNRDIEYNKKLVEEAEKVKVNTLDIIRNIHQLDMGLRGIALINAPSQIEVFAQGIENKKNLFNALEPVLKSHQFPMEKFYTMRDSVNLYIDFTIHLKDLVEHNQQEEFLKLLREDRGHFAWLAFKNYSDAVTAFENNISAQAQARYQQALKNTFILQIILFLIAVPTLVYTVFYTTKSLSISEKLRKTELENNEILAKQKENLEAMVQARTNEIVIHNERLISQQNEIKKQHQELSEQNLALKEAYLIIEDQNKIIQRKNEELSEEVAHQTQDLRQTNTELIEKNSRLEQFTFIISHNLRAPMARLTGLSSLLDMTEMENEREKIINLIVKSTSELDNVIKDLSMILGIQRLSTQVYSQIPIAQLVQKTLEMLEQDIIETKAEIKTDFTVHSIYSLPQYIESIFYNLISNAIKYRQPDKNPVINIKNYVQDNFILIEFCDQGLGIDVEKHKSNMFSLYKRFHFHVEGKGLGLYLVKTQIESLGGTIDVQSEPDKGTTFIVSLPIA